MNTIEVGKKRKVIPIFLFFLILTSSIGVWAIVGNSQRNSIEKDQMVQLDHTTLEITKEILDPVDLISELLVEQWIDVSDETELYDDERYEMIISSFYEFNDYYYGINWINTSGHIVKVYPYETNSAALNQSIVNTADGNPNLAYQRTMDTGIVSITPFIPFYQGSSGIVAYVPVEYENQVIGYFSVLISLFPILEDYVDQELLIENYQFVLSQNDDIVYEYQTENDYDNKNTQIRTFNILNQEFVIAFSLGPDIAENYTIANNFAIIVIGLIIALLVATSTNFYLKQSIIREEKLLEQQRYDRLMQRYEKLNALGTLAGGLAHDFNNILMSLQANLDLIQILPDDSLDQQSEIFATINKILLNSKDLTNRILAISRQQEFETHHLDVIEVLNDTLQIFESVKDKRISIVKNYNHKNSIAGVNYSHLSQSILNILNNASDAFPTGTGKITITTSNEVNEIGEEYIIISIKDNGIGIDPKQLKRVFDPFYTTKEMGQGTGLGLSIAYQYITQINGDLQIKSAVNKGTELILNIPVLRLDEQILSKNSNTASDQEILNVIAEFGTIRGRSPSILIVEDEILIANALKKLIENLEIDVQVTYDGSDAKGIFMDNNFDLIIVDINLPQINGMDLAEFIIQNDPSQQFLFITGFAETNIPIIVKANADLLQKPFSKSVIYNKIANRLKNQIK